VSTGSPKKTTSKLKVSARHLLAVNLVRLRAARKWSQDTLALEAGLHRTFVAHVERETRNISLDNLERLALALDVPVARLLQRRVAKK
jgi:transcriptional regulator with XRE-family HTH domain